jgi:hypothetical protein
MESPSADFLNHNYPAMLRQIPLNSPPSIRSDAPVIHFAGCAVYL